MTDPTQPNRRISIPDLKDLLETQILGRKTIELYDEIDSTNLRARSLAAAGAEAGVLVVAESQSAGRGRLGRSWSSPFGKNLYFSLVLRPNLALDKTPLITLTAGLGLAEAVTEIVAGVTDMEPRLKWPNDLIVNQRKIAGILVEMESARAVAPGVVLGIGLNVNLDASDLPPDLVDRAGSLFMCTGRVWDRTVLLATILRHLERNIMALEKGLASDILARYQGICLTLGERVRVFHERDSYEGLARGLGEDGALIVELDDGRVIQVNAGEVSLTRPIG